MSFKQGDLVRYIGKPGDYGYGGICDPTFWWSNRVPENLIYTVAGTSPGYVYVYHPLNPGDRIHTSNFYPSLFEYVDPFVLAVMEANDIPTPEMN